MSMSRPQHHWSLLPLLALLFVFAPAQQALAASSLASVILSTPGVNSASDSQLNSSTPATASLLGRLATGNAKSIVATGSAGVGMDLLTGTPIGSYSANANWNDTWVASGSTTFGSTITLTGQISTSLFTHYDDYWELTFDYNVSGNNYLHFAAFGDNGPINYNASAKGADITSSVLWTLNANPLLTDFSLTLNSTFVCGVCVATGGIFSDEMYASILVDGAGPITLDAFHTFHAEFRPLDPNVTLTSDAGRSVAAIPEPETYAMLVAGLGLLGFTARRRKQQAA